MIALGPTPAAALALAVEVEALARIYLAALAFGEPPVLSDEEMARVAARMRRMSYGEDADGEDAERPPGPARPEAQAPAPGGTKPIGHG